MVNWSPTAQTSIFTREELGKVQCPDTAGLPIIDPEEEYEWENAEHDEVTALSVAVRAEIFSKSAGKIWLIPENISRLQGVFQHLDEANRYDEVYCRTSAL